MSLEELNVNFSFTKVLKLVLERLCSKNKLLTSYLDIGTCKLCTLKELREDFGQRFAPGLWIERLSNVKIEK